jgi:hypothetical protein
VGSARSPSPHPPFRVALVTAVEVAPPQRWAHIPLLRKPLGHESLMRAVEEAVPYRHDEDASSPSPAQNWIEQVLLADEQALAVAARFHDYSFANTTYGPRPMRPI